MTEVKYAFRYQVAFYHLFGSKNESVACKQYETKGTYIMDKIDQASYRAPADQIS